MKRPPMGWALAGVLALAVSGTAITFIGCNSSSGPKTANVKAGDMPSGEEWGGVYYSEVFGNLHIIENGSGIVGRWQRTTKSHWGELEGTKEGNLLRYTWHEKQYGQVGPQATTSGKGYFVYSIDQNGFPVIKGEYGTSQDEVGSAWTAIKQRGKKANFDEIKGELGGSETPAVADEWDQDPSKKPKPPPPPEPKPDENANDAGAPPAADAGAAKDAGKPKGK